MTLRIAQLLVAVTLPLSAQQPMPGYTPSSAAAERALEADAITRPGPVSAAAHSIVLSRETHVSGTPAQARTRDYVLNQMRSWGLETEARTYDVWLPHPTEVHVWRIGSDARELSLAEPVVEGDSTSALPQYPTVNGYSGEGDATGDIVYVNYGLIEDYAALDSLGISARGKVVIARYGRSFRG
jgi:N-acetylated-alpha-linked acidic dipeptidase